MTRREKRRRTRRMLAGLFAAAAVLVPTAPAAIVLDEPADRVASSSGPATFVRADGPDGAVASIELRRDGNAALQEPYTTSAPPSGGGSEFDWTASGIGAASAALLLLLGFAGFRVVSRHGVAQA